MKTIAIIAGNKYESDQWVRLNGNLCNRYVYVRSIEDIRGIEFDKLQFVGTYRERDNWLELSDRIKEQIKYTKLKYKKR